MSGLVINYIIFELVGQFYQWAAALSNQVPLACWGGIAVPIWGVYYVKKRPAVGPFFVCWAAYFSAFLAAGFLAAGFLVATGFFVATFLAGAVAFGASLGAALFGTLAFLAIFTPAALAAAASWAFLRAAVFFSRIFFLTALSISDWALLRFSPVILAVKALTAAFKLRLVCWLRALRVAACFMRLIADAIIGIGILVYIYNNFRGHYTVDLVKSKGVGPGPDSDGGLCSEGAVCPDLVVMRQLVW